MPAPSASGRSRYRGRFAPSPTGPLHWGSLYTAVASWLDARSHDGTWLIRMEDVDGLRCRREWGEDILDTLSAHGLTSDEPVIWQSGRHTLYQRQLDSLIRQGHVYACPCSRKALSQGHHRPDCPSGREKDVAWRLGGRSEHVVFRDRIRGLCHLPPAPPAQDPVLRRRDGFWAYQMAVVCDDLDQHITHIVRGQDLLECTHAQIRLFRFLGASAPEFMHLPLITRGGQKLSKQNLAEPVDKRTPADNLRQVLLWLGITHPEVHAERTPERLLATAIAYWPCWPALWRHNIPLG
ncbi:tRNA glutamyl-Q(34) synthetase GluQRS [Hahella sp. SMD15-11]|uniref:tRNA glutamyl-Q(34) synthetase GluQRS n=1 Tax=Thermohahella caldifontis TaxID=3142973 RepID=A0AB39UV68_9GAMM